MTWLVFAFCGPVLWAISTHLDKYLVERYFKQSSVAVLLIFTAFAGLALLPIIWLWQPTVIALDAGSVLLMALAGILYGVNELINIGGALGNRYALVLAPLSLVQAIGSTTTLFVFIFGIVLSKLLPSVGRESLSRSELLQKGGAAVLVAVGVALVSR